MTITALPSELTTSLTKLLRRSDTDHLSLSYLLNDLSSIILKSLQIIHDHTQQLQQEKLSVATQKSCISNIQEQTIEITTLVNNLINFSRLIYEADENPSLAEQTAELLPNEFQGMHALVIDDNPEQQTILLKHLKSFGLHCTAANTAEALTLLRNAEQQNFPYQIAIVSAPHFDHHVAYLARTIKTSPQLYNVMLALVLPTKLLNFEKERAYFSGFACVLNLTKPARLLSKLLTSWRGWAAKNTFSSDQSQLSQNHILLVEDDPIPQKVLQRQLAELGYEVDIAADGLTALKLLEQRQYSLVFMDIGLPDISGLEVTTQLRKREQDKRHTPIIGLTIYALESDEETGLQAGMDAYLVKPLLQAPLKEVLNQWLTPDA